MKAMLGEPAGVAQRTKGHVEGQLGRRDFMLSTGCRFPPHGVLGA